MDQGPVGATEECFSVGAEEMVVHSEEVVTSNEVVINPPPVAVPVNHQLPQAQSAPIYNIPTLITTPGPIMQVVTLQTVQTPSSPQVGLTNALRNIRLIAIQPKLPMNGTNGRAQPISLQPSPKPEIKIQPQPRPNEANKKVAVNSFYSKLKPTQPVTLAPKPNIIAQTNYHRQPQQHVVKPSPSYYKEQQREREMKEFSHLNEELQRGLRILLDLTTSLHHNTTWPFMEQVDPVKDGAPDYHQVVKKPMWLSLIKDKFRQNQYTSISDFVSDMRLILENCYRYNGPNHPITKKALRLEQSLEQKLALLPSDLRSLCAIAEVESERKARPGSSDAYFSVLLHRVRHEREQREQLAREKRAEEVRLRREEKERQRCLWAERMMNPQVKAQMKTMWEIPQIGHFLHLARGALHIGEIAQYELEHMFLMPEASALLATLMTSLLSSPNQRVKLAESPPTPYAVWSARVGSRVAEWYRTYNREGRQFVKLHELLGLEPMFWRVCGDTNPLEGGKLYHQLSFLKRVWIFKGICDTVAHSHKTVQEAMAEEEGPESRQVTLGQDANGYTYLHFPAVSGSDIRVYRQKSWDLEADPIWGPITAERREAEEERIREEELKAAELKKRKRASTASKRASTTPARKSQSPAKKRQAARTPTVNTTPAPTRKRSSVDERPSRIGTRVSPRTLQRQTGLTLYKDTSSESEEEESNEASDGSEEPVDGVEEEEEQPSETPAVVAVAKVAQRKRRGRRTRGRKRPVKKKLQKIVEETEEVIKEDEQETVKEDVTQVKKDNEEEKVEKIDQENEEVKKEDEINETKPLPNGDFVKEDVKEEETETPVKEEKIDGAEVKEEIQDDAVKMEEDETPPAAPTQRFTVSQLLQKLAPTAEEEETEKPSTSPTPEVPPAPSTEAEPAKPDTVEEVDASPDPERTSYDPYFFELIISSVEELQEWINQFTDPDDDEDRKPRPRCEIKLRERLQSLLEEAKPLASDQQQANQKICQQLWKEWERFRCSSAGNRQPADEIEQTGQDSIQSEPDTEQDDNGSLSGGSDDGLRHSRRLRVKRNRNVANGSQESTRSSSPIDEEPAAKQGRKSSYNFDPAWESDPSTTPEVPTGRRRSNYVPEMKNPEFWVGRRVTRATAPFVDVSEENASPPPPATPNSQQQEEEKVIEKSPSSTVQSDKLIDQLRQLRRQQALLSSNDPHPSGSTASPNGSPAVYFPSKDGHLVRITNPRTAELLSQLKIIRPGQPNSPIAPQPRKILIQQRPPSHLQKPGASPAAPVSIDITNLISQAAEKGLIVAHEQRRLMFDVGDHGSFLVTAQMTPNGPKVISATPLPRKVKTVTNAAAAALAAPVGVPQSVPTPSAVHEPAALAVSEPAPVAVPEPAAVAVPEMVAAPTPAAEATTPVEPASTPTNPPTTATNGSPVVKQVFVNDPRQNNILSADVLRSVAGPEAVGAKLTIVKEGNTKMLTLILSNGETRRLTTSQVQQIQAAVRNKTKPDAAAS